MTIEAQQHTEIHLINQTLAAFAIDAGTRPGWTVVAGTSYIAYGLCTGRSQPIDAIERRLPEPPSASAPTAACPPLSACVAFPSPSKCPTRRPSRSTGAPPPCAGPASDHARRPQLQRPACR